MLKLKNLCVMKNLINWFEIPVSDMDRAVAFYSKLLDGPIQVEDFGGFLMGWLPMENQQAVGGSLVKHETYVPSHHGSLVYLNGNDDLSVMLGRVESAGGKILSGKTQITPEIGYMAIFEDSEGNRIALHSQN